MECRGARWVPIACEGSHWVPTECKDSGWAPSGGNVPAGCEGARWVHGHHWVLISCPLYGSGCPQGTHWVPVWVLCGFPFGSCWIFIGYSVDSLRVPIGFLLSSHWIIIGYSLVSQWVPMGFPLGAHWVSIGYSLGSHWVPFGCVGPMGHPWVGVGSVPISCTRETLH